MEKIYNFAKKDFFIFASTYVAIIFLVLLCFFPVCRAFERSEQNQAIAEIRDYASSMLGELDLQEQAIFNATRNLYSDRDFTSIYYNSTRSSSSSLFYDMTLLQKRIKLYYQNLEYVQDVLVYLPICLRLWGRPRTMVLVFSVMVTVAQTPISPSTSSDSSEQSP